MADPRYRVRSQGEVFDSSIAAWIPDPKTSAGGLGSGSTQVSVSSVAGIVSVAQASTVWAVQAAFQVASTVSRSSVTQSSTSVTLQTSNATRLMWSAFNHPTQGANLYVKFGATASTSDFDVRLPPLAYYELPRPIYTGRIDGVWDSTGAGFARVCEWVP